MDEAVVKEEPVDEYGYPALRQLQPSQLDYSVPAEVKIEEPCEEWNQFLQQLRRENEPPSEMKKERTGDWSVVSPQLQQQERATPVAGKAEDVDQEATGEQSMAALPPPERRHCFLCETNTDKYFETPATPLDRRFFFNRILEHLDEDERVVISILVDTELQAHFCQSHFEPQKGGRREEGASSLQPLQQLQQEDRAATTHKLKFVKAPALLATKAGRPMGSNFLEVARLADLRLEQEAHKTRLHKFSLNLARKEAAVRRQVTKQITEKRALLLPIRPLKHNILAKSPLSGERALYQQTMYRRSLAAAEYQSRLRRKEAALVDTTTPMRLPQQLQPVKKVQPVAKPLQLQPAAKPPLLLLQPDPQLPPMPQLQPQQQKTQACRRQMPLVGLISPLVGSTPPAAFPPPLIVKLSGNVHASVSDEQLEQLHRRGISTIVCRQEQ